MVIPQRFYGALAGVLLMISPVWAQAPPALKAATFLPQWIPQAQFAGYYVAAEKGFYRKAGLDVTVLRGGPGAPPGETLAKRKTAFATLFLADALVLREKGVPLVNIAQIVRRSGYLLVAKKGSGIHTPQDLAGKKIGLWQSFEVQPRAFFRKYNLQVRIVPQGPTINLFLRGGVDAASAMWYNEYHLLLNAGWDENEFTPFFFHQHGLNFPEDGIYVLAETAAKDPDLCRRFVKASLEGWRFAFAHPEEALDIVMKYVSEAKSATNRVHQRWMLARMKDLIMPKEDRTLPGPLSPADYETTVEELVKSGVLQKAPLFKDFHVDCSAP